MVVRKWDGDGLSFGDYCVDLDCIWCEYRLELARMGRECFKTCGAQGCEGAFKVGCVYVCHAWDAEIPTTVADMRSRWRRDAKVARMRV